MWSGKTASLFSSEVPTKQAPELCIGWDVLLEASASMSPHSQLTLSPQSLYCLSLAILLTIDISIILHPKSCTPSILLPEGLAISSYHIGSDLSCFLSIPALEAQGLSKSLGFRLYPQFFTVSQQCIVKTHGKNKICHTHWWRLLSMNLSLLLQHRWVGAGVGDPAVDLACNDHI